jgi:hypothetical protein
VVCVVIGSCQVTSRDPAAPQPCLTVIRQPTS